MCEYTSCCYYFCCSKGAKGGIKAIVKEESDFCFLLAIKLPPPNREGFPEKIKEIKELVSRKEAKSLLNLIHREQRIPCCVLFYIA